MPAIAFSTAAVDSAKRALRDFMPDRKSSHITEALAASLGFKTHAALTSAIGEAPDETRFIELNELAFQARITSLEGTASATWGEDDQGWSELPRYPDRRLGRVINWFIAAAEGCFGAVQGTKCSECLLPSQTS